MSPHIPPSEIELRRIRSAVEDGAETLDAIGKRFGRSRRTIVGYVACYGWSNERIAAQRGLAPVKTRLAIKRGHKANGYMANPAKYVAEKRREVEAVDRNLYGSLLDDVQYLRRRGWVVNREGSGFRVGNSVVDGAALMEKAARERRLACS